MKDEKVKSVFEKCLDDFVNWLEENSDVKSKGSRNSYRSYVKGVFDLLNNDYGENFLKIEKKALGKKDGKELLFIERLLAEKVEIKKKKTIQNYISGYRLFVEFLLLDDKKDNYRIAVSEGIKNKIDRKEITWQGDIVYNKSILRKIFLSRLVTQDRKVTKKDNTNVLMYPTRLLNKIFSNSRKYKQDYKNFLNYDINKAKFYVDKSNEKECIFFENISSLSMSLSGGDNYLVKIKADGKEYNVYSKSIDGKFSKLKVKGIGDVSIDHDYPISNALNEYAKDSVCLKKLTDIILNDKDKIKNKNNKAINASDVAHYVYSHYNSEFDDNFCENLLNEMKYISKKVKGFTILSKIDNIKKNNK